MVDQELVLSKALPDLKTDRGVCEAAWNLARWLAEKLDLLQQRWRDCRGESRQNKDRLAESSSKVIELECRLIARYNNQGMGWSLECVWGLGFMARVLARESSISELQAASASAVSELDHLRSDNVKLLQKLEVCPAIYQMSPEPLPCVS